MVIYKNAVETPVSLCIYISMPIILKQKKFVKNKQENFVTFMTRGSHLAEKESVKQTPLVTNHYIFEEYN